MNKKICIDCGKNESVERNRCKECVKIFNRIRAKKYYKKGSPRYGVVPCEVCGEPVSKTNKNQRFHKECYTVHKSIDNYNKAPRSNNGTTLARSMVIKLGFKLNKNLAVHHVDENPYNNVFSNFWIINFSLHRKLHSFLQDQRRLLEKSEIKDLENHWNILRGQLTETWLKTTKSKIQTIYDVDQAVNEPLIQDVIYRFADETADIKYANLKMIKANTKKVERERKFCQLCGKLLSGDQIKYCSHEHAQISKRKVNRPDKLKLEEDISKLSWTAIGRKYGVSDNAVRKWAKQYDLL